jgi:hypothetical protein
VNTISTDNLPKTHTRFSAGRNGLQSISYTISMKISTGGMSISTSKNFSYRLVANATGKEKESTSNIAMACHNQTSKKPSG